MALQDGRTALMCAVSKGHVDCARLLIESGADKEAIDNVRIVVHCFVVRVCGWIGGRLDGS